MSRASMLKPYDRKPFTYIHLPMDFSPKYCTLDEACSYARHGRWQGHQKIKQSRWRSFKDGRRRVIEFASVIEDEERLKRASARPAEPVAKKNSVGRPKSKSVESVSAE